MEKNDRMKTIRKWLFVAIIVILILIFASQKQASALVYKDKYYTQMDPYIRSGDLSQGSNQINLDFDFTNEDTIPLSFYQNYDLVALQIQRFAIRAINVNHIISCSSSDAQNQSVTYFCSDNDPNANYYGNGTYWTLMGFAYYKDGTSSPCWTSSEYNDMILCPLDKTSPLDKMSIRLTTIYTLSQIHYEVGVGGWKYFYNYDSTDIINSNGTIVNQQQQTNSILSGTDTTGATTNGTSLFGSAQSELDTGINNTTGEANLVTIVQTFFTQIDNSTCQPIQLPIPFTNETLVLPCIGTELQTRVPLLWTLYTTIITGVLVFRFWNFAIDMIKHLVDPYSTGLSGVSDISGGGK